MQQFIEDDSNGPDVIFDGVYVFLESLRRHVKRAAHVVLLLLAWIPTSTSQFTYSF